MALETEPGSQQRARGELKRDLIRYLPSQGIPALIGFFTIPILTRLFEPAAYGDYRLILATVGIFGSAGSWMAASIYRFYPELELSNRLDDFRTTLTRLFIATSGLFALLWLMGTVAAGPFVDSNFQVLLVIGLILMVVNLIWSAAAALVRAVREVGVYSTSAVLNKVLTLGAGIALVVILGLGVDGLVYGSVLGSVVLLPMLFRVVRKNLPKVGSFDTQLAKNMLRYGLPLTLMQLANWALQLSDRYIIAGLRGTGEVGLYTAAYGIAEQGMRTILLLFQMPFAILGHRVWERDGREAAADFVTGSTRSYLLVAVPALGGLVVLARPIMGVMADASYRDAATIMPPVAGAMLVGGIMWWYASGSTFVKKTGRQAIAVGAAVLVNVTLNLALVGTYGYQVAAVTTLVAYAVGLAAMIFLSRDFRWKFPFLSLARAAAATLAMMGALAVFVELTDFGAGGTLLFSIVLGVFVYGAALLLTGEPEAHRLLRRLTNSLRTNR